MTPIVSMALCSVLTGGMLLLPIHAQNLRNTSPFSGASFSPTAVTLDTGSGGGRSEMLACPKGPLPSQGFSKPRQPAKSMVKITQINSSAWQDPQGLNYYASEYWITNTGAYEICDVKLSIPLTPGMDMTRVRVNSSFGLSFDEKNESSNVKNDSENGLSHSNNRDDQYDGGMPGMIPQKAEELTFSSVSTTNEDSPSTNSENEMTAKLSPFYIQEIRSKEAVDVGFVLLSPDATSLSQTGMAKVSGARYCDGGIEQEQHQIENTNIIDESGPGQGVESGGVPDAPAVGIPSTGETPRRPDYSAGGH